MQDFQEVLPVRLRLQGWSANLRLLSPIMVVPLHKVLTESFHLGQRFRRGGHIMLIKMAIEFILPQVDGLMVE